MQAARRGLVCSSDNVRLVRNLSQLWLRLNDAPLLCRVKSGVELVEKNVP